MELLQFQNTALKYLHRNCSSLEDTENTIYQLSVVTGETEDENVQ